MTYCQEIMVVAIIIGTLGTITNHGRFWNASESLFAWKSEYIETGAG